MPAANTVIAWSADGENYGDFALRYARARDQRADALAEEIITLADEAKHYTAEGIQAARLRVDARKWIASKLMPKKYGDKPDEVHVNTTVNNIAMTEERRMELIERNKKALGV